MRRLFVASSIVVCRHSFRETDRAYTGVGGPKTVHVRSYKTKIGETAESYNRAAAAPK